MAVAYKVKRKNLLNRRRRAWLGQYLHFFTPKKKKKRNGTQYNVNKWETNSFINSSRIPIWFINNEIYFNLHVDKINFMIEE